MASDFRWCLHLGNSQIIFRLIQDRKRAAILSRRILTDGQCAIIAPLVPGKQGDHGRTGTDNRLFLDAILRLARSASPWRDLPPEPGNWRTGPSRFRNQLRENELGCAQRLSPGARRADRDWAGHGESPEGSGQGRQARDVPLGAGSALCKTSA